MTVIPVRMLWGPGAGRYIDAALDNYILNDADDAVAYIFVAPKAGVIDMGSLAIGTETGTSPAYKIGFCTVDASGNPTQTAFGGSSEETQTFTSAGLKTQAFATGATVAAGDLLCLHIWPTASAPDASNNVTVLLGPFGGAGDASLPTVKEYSTSWALSGVIVPAFGYRYSDGEWFGGAILDSNSFSSFDSADSPDEWGVGFSVPVQMTITGMILQGIDAPAAGNTFTLHLYDAASSELRDYDFDADIDTTSNGVWTAIFATPLELTPDVTYRATVTNSSATDVMATRMISVGDANQRNIVPEGERWFKTTRTDGGAWTDDTTRIAQWALLVSSITASAAVGFVGSLMMLGVGS